jgi:hypothetical protein
VRRPLQVVRVGQLPLPPGPPRRLAVWRWREAAKLLLRCALLAALAFALAQPEWHPAPTAPARLALRVPGGDWPAAAQAEWRRVLGDGADARWLAAGFPPADGPEPAPAAEFAAPWSLLRELDARVAAESRAVVFGPTDAARFAGARPTLARLQVSWWPTNSVLTSAAAGGARAAPRVAVLAAADRAEDLRFVRAALGAMAAIETAEAPDWIVQLGEVALPPALAARVEAGARLIRDAGGAPTAIDGDRTFVPGPARMTLRQRAAVTAAGRVRLRDSAGEPLWTETRQGAGEVWHWALRFHPDWTDWPLRAEFPAWWEEIMRPAPAASAPVPAAQAAPAFDPAAAERNPALPSLGAVDLRLACWVLALLLFATERGWAWAQARRVPR